MQQVTDAHALLRQAHLAEPRRDWLDRERDLGADPRPTGGFAWAGRSDSIESLLFLKVDPYDPQADDARPSAEMLDGGAAAFAIVAGDGPRQEIARCS